MNFFGEILSNELFLTGVCAWAAAQIIKTVIYGVMNHRLDLERLVGDGGMPSGHSATVTSMAVKCGMLYGFDSPYFAIMGIMAIIVMHDAMGVRRETGKQTRIINLITELLDMSDILQDEKKLKEFMGHTPRQVICGAFVGLIIALII